MISILGTGCSWIVVAVTRWKILIFLLKPSLQTTHSIVLLKTLIKFASLACLFLGQQLSFLVAGYFDYQVVVGRCGSGGNLDCPGSTSHGNLCCELDLLPELWFYIYGKWRKKYSKTISKSWSIFVWFVLESDVDISKEKYWTKYPSWPAVNICADPTGLLMLVSGWPNMASRPEAPTPGVNSTLQHIIALKSEARSQA